MIDLHCHSHFSDGRFSPTLLLEKAVSKGIRLLALTDHDTVAGLDELHQAASNQPIQIINGIELSTRWKKYDIHILGLHICKENPDLQQIIQQQNESRIQRAKEIALRLQTCGIDDAYKKACDIAGHTRVARPHFAQVLVNEGYAKDIAKAFKSYLRRGRPAYVATPWISIEEAVATIKQANGMAVIAHPLKYKLTRLKLHELINTFKLAGGMGVEVVSGQMTMSEMKELAGFCQRYELFASSGSDFHNDNSNISLGSQSPLPVNCTPIWEQWTL